MTKPIQIDIKTYPRFSLRRWAMVISLYVGMFGAGLLADSAGKAAK